MLYPLIFQPIFKERVWGGRELARLYGKNLPANAPIGESWEISDRPGDASVIANGPLAGKSLRWLMQTHRAELLGDAKPLGEHFPLLIKLLDAREKLSLQVHPPAHKAKELGGDPKTEMWFIADAVPGAELYVGLKRGVTRADFERKIQDGSVADCFHRVPVKAGDTMFLPSGRVHAIGAGLVIFEIQQNSDTTYRVFDWNRIGLDGQPRELHVPQSLASIDFNDFEPPLAAGKITEYPNFTVRRLVEHELFAVELVELKSPAVLSSSKPQMQIISLVGGKARVSSPDGDEAIELTAGQFCLVPAALQKTDVSASAGCRFLRVTAG
ncbi:MAG: mannose-6-phosphate isomerase [Verrucomicrobia bacterium]|nr:MAG: mannose-6-phosphate isomerase [Verrucomicrobiota bacterium]